MADICRVEEEIPTDDRKWPWFLMVSGLIFGSGLVLIIIGRVLLYFFHGGRRKSNSVIDMNEVSNVVLTFKQRFFSSAWF